MATPVNGINLLPVWGPQVPSSYEAEGQSAQGAIQAPEDILRNLYDMRFPITLKCKENLAESSRLTFELKTIETALESNNPEKDSILPLCVSKLYANTLRSMVDMRVNYLKAQRHNVAFRNRALTAQSTTDKPSLHSCELKLNAKNLILCPNSDELPCVSEANATFRISVESMLAETNQRILHTFLQMSSELATKLSSVHMDNNLMSDFANSYAATCTSGINHLDSDIVVRSATGNGIVELLPITFVIRKLALKKSIDKAAIIDLDNKLQQDNRLRLKKEKLARESAAQEILSSSATNFTGNGAFRSLVQQVELNLAKKFQTSSKSPKNGKASGPVQDRPSRGMQRNPRNKKFSKSPGPSRSPARKGVVYQRQSPGRSRSRGRRQSHMQSPGRPQSQRRRSSTNQSQSKSQSPGLSRSAKQGILKQPAQVKDIPSPPNNRFSPKRRRTSLSGSSDQLTPRGSGGFRRGGARSNYGHVKGRTVERGGKRGHDPGHSSW